MKSLKYSLYLILQDFLGMLCNGEVCTFEKLFKYCVTIHTYACVFVHFSVHGYMCMYVQMDIKSLNIGWSATGT